MADLLKDRFKEAREAARLTQLALATLLGVHVNSCSNWETGKANPPVDVVQKLSQVSGYELNWIATGEPPKYRFSRAFDAPMDVLIKMEGQPEYQRQALEHYMGGTAKLVAAKTTRRMTDSDRAQVAATHLAELEHASRDDREALAEMVRDLATNAVTRSRVLEHYQFIRWKDKKKT